MTSTTNALTHDQLDPRLILDRTIATASSVIDGVQRDQLADPTPCPEMDVRAMLGHLVGVVGRIAALGRGEDPFAVTETPVPGDGWSPSGARRPSERWKRGAMTACSNSRWRCPGYRAPGPRS